MSDKKILIVGGASGIGRVTSELLLDRGCKPIIADNDEEKLNQWATEWGGKCKLFIMDIANQDNVRDGLNWINEHECPLDSVVITAAVHSCYPVEYLPDDVIDRVIDINLVSHIKFVRDIIPLIKEGGRIIAVSSVSAGVGIPMQSIYSASKAGLEIFYESLSVELSYKNIRCVIIQPSNVNTGFNETGNDYEATGNRYIDDVYKKVIERIDSRYGMPPKSVAEVILKSIFCKSPKLGYVVGMNAQKAHWAKRLLGRNLAIKVLSKVFGL